MSNNNHHHIIVAIVGCVLDLDVGKRKMKSFGSVVDAI